MPARDTHHALIKQALIKDGWQITDDPYVISYGERFLFVDLGATWPPPPNSGQLIGLQQGDCQIAVEIKVHLTHNHPRPLLGKVGSIPCNVGGAYSPPWQGGAGGGCA